MPTYTAPLNDMKFVLLGLLEDAGLEGVPSFQSLSPDLIDPILEEGARFAQEILQPLNQCGDREGCRRDESGVTTPAGFRDAYHTFVDGGWTGLTGDPEYGGQGLPHVMGLAQGEMSGSANLAFSTYPGLTGGAVDAILVHGTDAQKSVYLPKMISGAWSGTMNLTEPHCGTDLGLIRTRAEPRDDGSYAITGTKIFITAGEHDLTENIVHLVLAKIPGGPEGVHGISLFIVPKFIPGPDGEPDERNGVGCGRLEEKMGLHGSATCEMNYDGATGYLVGEPHRGLHCMFTMMNAARLGVGLQGLALSEVAYQNAVNYARERHQGRALTGPVQPEKSADPIIVHPDVRRMLMEIRVFNEGARALIYWAGVQVDVAEHHPDPGTRERAHDLLGLLTPVIKAYGTDKGFEATNLALQCFGGHGYIREWGMEQFVRDARIAQIYEGANGIQALDLVGRKLPANSGRAMQVFVQEVADFCRAHEDRPEIDILVDGLAQALSNLQAATQWLSQHGREQPNEAGAASMDYLYLTALVALGLMWGRQAADAARMLDAGEGDAAFLNNKLISARYFAERVMSASATHLARIKAGSESLMAMEAEAF
jgi:alkylation response protein AidB-like acyl-CoA dehydrogenase